MKPMTPDLYGISNCDSVKKARKWLEGQGLAYRFHDFRKDGLDANDLHGWVEALGWEALLNRRSTTWRKLDEADKADLDSARAESLMLREPTLIKRPVLVAAGRVLAGFSETSYEEMFN
jgi:Spx/MgsR family transcriptional regulator